MRGSLVLLVFASLLWGSSLLAQAPTPPPRTSATATTKAAPASKPKTSTTAATAAPTVSPSAATSASPPAASTAPLATSPEVQALQARLATLRALLDQTLVEDVDVSALCGVADVTSDALVKLERRRLETLLSEPATPEPSASASVHEPVPPAPSAGGSAAEPSEDLDPLLLAAQREFDETRLKLFSLSTDVRQKLLTDYRRRVEEKQAALDHQQRELNEAERRSKEAEQAQREALEAAERATSEAIKLLRQEQARLLSVKKQQADFEAALIQREEKLTQRAEQTLGWRRKTNEFLKKHDEQASPEPSDVLYAEIRQVLTAARSELDEKLDTVLSQHTSVPSVGEDQVETGQISIDRSEYDELRGELVKQEQVLAAREHLLTWREAQGIMAQVEALNAERLRLFPYLSDERRDQLTTFSEVGFRQGRSELLQAQLVLRFHILTAVRWVDGVRTGRGGQFTLVPAMTVLKALLLSFVFLWWRKHGPAILESREQELRNDRDARWSAQRLQDALRIYRHTRQPLELLLLAWGLRELLGEEMQQLLEVEVLWIFATWVLGGTTLVLFINAIAQKSSRSYVAAPARDVGALRLKSLRLVGRVIVVFGLILALSSAFVGQGTLHTWVIETCWFAAIPVWLILVRWWQPVIFERLEPHRNRNRFAGWVANNQQGWKSFPAAAAGGAYLFGLGVVRFSAEYLTGLNVVRMLLAYLFQRSMTDKASEGISLTALDDKLQARLLAPADIPVEVPSQAELLQAVGQALSGRGGVFALVGERGCGKSTSVQQLVKQYPDALVLPVGSKTLKGFRNEVARLLELPDAKSEEQFKLALAACAKSQDGKPLIIVEDAHRFMKPTIGGLQRLVDILSLARAAASATWLFTFNHAMFSLFDRSYGARPAFDDVFNLTSWSEEEIAQLLEAQNQALGIDPNFELLLTSGVPTDEIDRAEKIARTKEGYYRMLWNYSSGNPGVALHAWVHCLGNDESGRLCVGPFQPPDTSDLERLPDPSVFVLRALVRLGRATESEIAEAANLDVDRVRAALRYARHRGYVDQVDDHHLRISKHWFRGVTRVLQRRHFLTAPS